MTARVGWGAMADRAPVCARAGLPGLVTGLGLARRSRSHCSPGEPRLVSLLALLAGVSLNGWQGLWTYRLTEIAGVARAGTASGVALTFVALSITLAPPTFGGIADAASMKALWAVLAGMLVIALASPSPRIRGGARMSRTVVVTGSASGIGRATPTGSRPPVTSSSASTCATPRSRPTSARSRGGRPRLPRSRHTAPSTRSSAARASRRRAT